MKYLFVGAHPDDIEISCGGTISRLLRNQCDVKIVILTHSEDSRKDEAEKALEIIGIDKKHVSMYNEPDGKIVADSRLVSVIEKEIESFQPDMVITHFESDTHQDHRNVAMAVISACRKCIQLCFFDSYSSENFRPDIFVRLSDSDECAKENAIEAHKSQLGGSADILTVSRIKALSYGLKCSSKFAEAFSVGRVIL